MQARIKIKTLLQRREREIPKPLTDWDQKMEFLS